MMDGLRSCRAANLCTSLFLMKIMISLLGQNKVIKKKDQNNIKRKEKKKKRTNFKYNKTKKGIYKFGGTVLH